MFNLNNLESKSICIIREAYKQFKNPALLWSIGKDSTTLLWLCRKAFFGEIPFPVIHIDTGYKFKEIYDFRDEYAKKWNLNLIITKNKDAFETPETSKFECCNSRKTEALNQIVKKYKFDSLLVGIRRDEHGIRGKERYFSPRDKQFKWNVVKKQNNGDSPFESLQDAEFDGWNIYATDFGTGTNHVRVHPLLHWTELEIWQYIKKEKILSIPLYFAKNGKRYRSIGCEPCCSAVVSDATDVDKIIEELKKNKTPEREGRAQDKEDEYNMQKLRSLGYM
ncbi:MAG: sulfate adenylyltransferase subunit CysD [Candidatus Omnitrophica bacterium]|nr:sulfate adenylyltransferase subunit CysD [Candidatus Omnitrophota bacterium]